MFVSVNYTAVTVAVPAAASKRHHDNTDNRIASLGTEEELSSTCLFLSTAGHSHMYWQDPICEELHGIGLDLSENCK